MIRGWGQEVRFWEMELSVTMLKLCLCRFCQVWLLCSTSLRDTFLIIILSNYVYFIAPNMGKTKIHVISKYIL